MTYSLLANMVWFQAIFMLSLNYQHQYFWLSLILFFAHLSLIENRVRELKIIVVGLVAAFFVDSAYAALGVFSFSHEYGLIIPAWLVLIWCAFACSLTRGLRYFRHRYALGALAAGLAGPFCYWNGQRLGAVEFPLGIWPTLALLSLSWALVFPAMNWLINNMIDQQTDPNSLQSKRISNYN